MKTIIFLFLPIFLFAEYKPIDFNEYQPKPQLKFIINRQTFEMKVFKNNKVIQTHRVIVGKSTKPTPLLNTQIIQIEFNPEWVVPDDIMSNMFSKFKNKKNPIQYINTLGYHILNENNQQINPNIIDWANSSPQQLSKTYKITQSPNKYNVLGQILFILEGTGSIQMHGTSNPELFNHTIRRFSSGCIRVENAITIAELLLNKTANEIQEILDSKQRRRIKVKIKNKIVVEDDKTIDNISTF